MYLSYLKICKTRFKDDIRKKSIFHARMFLMFRLAKEESDVLRSQIVTSNTETKNVITNCEDIPQKEEILNMIFSCENLDFSE